MVRGKWLQNLPCIYAVYDRNWFSRSRPYKTLEWTNIGGSQHTQNTGAYTGPTTNMEATNRNGERKMQQETKLFETSGGNSMGGGSINPTKVHKMLVLSAVELGSAAYGPAWKIQFKILDPIHNKGAFCINRTQNFLIGAG
jgi:hypothetical protein